jgi:hypothetical protein
LIRTYDLVSHLHHQLKRDVRFFNRDHHVMDVAAVTLQQVGDLLCCASMEFLHLVDGGFQDRAKVTLTFTRARSGCGPKLDEVGKCR